MRRENVTSVVVVYIFQAHVVCQLFVIVLLLTRASLSILHANFIKEATSCPGPKYGVRSFVYLNIVYNREYGPPYFLDLKQIIKNEQRSDMRQSLPCHQ